MRENMHVCTWMVRHYFNCLAYYIIDTRRHDNVEHAGTIIHTICNSTQQKKNNAIAMQIITYHDFV